MNAADRLTDIVRSYWDRTDTVTDPDQQLALIDEIKALLAYVKSLSKVEKKK